MRWLAHWLLLCAIAPTAAARADSDGYMCIGPAYLAIESRSFDSDGQHRLFIYWLNDSIGPRTEVALPDFQTHDLECTTGAVKVRGWDEIHDVDVSQRTRPHYIGSTAAPRADTLDSSATARHVSIWPSGRLALGELPGHPYYEMRISKSVEAHMGAIETTTIAKLLRRSSDGGYLDSRIVYAGTSIETVD